MSLFVVGYTCVPGSKAAELMPDFQAPSNYGEEAAQRFIQRKQDEWSATCAYRPLCGRISEIVILTDTRNKFTNE